MRQELFHHANWPAQIDFNLSSDVFEASSFVVNIDLTHDAGVIDQNVELRKLFGDLFVKSGDRFRIGNVASKGVKFWQGRFRTVHLSLIAARDKNRVTKRRELFGEFVTDAAGAPVIKIVLLVSFIIKYPLSDATIYKSHSTSTRRLRRLTGGLRINAE